MPRVLQVRNLFVHAVYDLEVLSLFTFIQTLQVSRFSSPLLGEKTFGSSLGNGALLQRLCLLERNLTLTWVVGSRSTCLA